MKTIKEFVEQSNIDASLIRATVRQVGGWEAFKELAQDVTNHGAAGGFVGFTYYTDTVAFSKRSKAAIVDRLSTIADELGENALLCLAGFNCLKDYTVEEVADGLYNPRSDYRTAVYNALAWFVLEEVARSYCDMVDGY